MGAPVRSLDVRPEVLQCFATVVGEAGPRWLLRTDAGADHDAARAVSCLVDPRLGDRVLVAVGPGEAFVLAVLHREDVEAEGVELSAPGDLTLKAPGGSFRVAAAEAIELAANGRVSLTSPTLSVNANEGSVAVRALTFVGDKLHADLDSVKTVARHVDSLLDRFSQRVRRSFRFVEETDTVQAEAIDQTVRETWHLRARHAITHTEKLVKVDAEQIQLG